jgi:hypothetical protein
MEDALEGSLYTLVALSFQTHVRIGENLVKYLRAVHASQGIIFRPLHISIVLSNVILNMPAYSNTFHNALAMQKKSLPYSTPNMIK